MDFEGPRRFRRRLAGVCLLLVGIGLTGAAVVFLSRKPEPAVVVAPGPRAEVLPRESPSAVSPAAREKETAKRETPAWTITGRVLRDERPAAGVAVVLTAAETILRAETAVDGKFELLGAPGKVPLRLAIDDPASAPVGFKLQLDPPDGQERVDLGEIVLQPATSILVRLIDSKGMLLGGGVVRMAREEPASTGSQVLVEMEDLEALPTDDGEYIFERARRGIVRIDAEVPGYGLNFEYVALPRDEPLVLLLALGLHIGGTVRDMEGMPIEGADLEIGSESNRDFKTRTDASGRFLVETLDSLYRLVISATAEGYAKAERGGVLSGREDVELRLFREAVVAGQVVSAVDRLPLKGATVWMESEGAKFETKSDPSGRFEIKGIPPGGYKVEVDHEEFCPWMLEALELDEGEKCADLLATLEAGITVKGRVVELETDQPISGARVAVGVETEKEASIYRYVMTQLDGGFTVRGLPRGDLSLEASAERFADARLAPAFLVDGSDVWTIQLQRSGAIEGRVLDPEGVPIADTPVNLGCPNAAPPEVRMVVARTPVARTDRQGTYRFTGLLPYDGYALRTYNPRYLAVERDGIAVECAMTVRGVDLQMRRGGAIRGRVLDVRGNGKAGEIVLAKGEGALKPGDSRTKEDGSYEISPLEQGFYTVEVSAPGAIPPDPKRVTIDAGRAAEGVDFVDSGGIVLSAMVIDDADRPVSGCSLTINAVGRYGYGRTDDEGRFRFSGLPAGPVVITPENLFGHEGTVVRVVVPAGELLVRLQRWGSISGRVTAASTMSFPPGRVESEIWGNQWIPGIWEATDRTGRFDLPVPAGRHRLMVSIPGFAAAGVEVSVQPGQTREILVPLVPAGTIQGAVVRDATADPIGDALIQAVNPAGRWLPSRELEESNSSGHFSLDSLPAGPVSLIVTHKDYATSRIGPIVVRVGETAEVQIALRPSWGVRGSVSSVGRQWAGAEVTARGLFAGGPEMKTVTGNDGFYELEALPPGRYDLQASARTHDGRSVLMQRRIAVAQSGFQEVDFSLEEVRLTVHVRRAGAPAEGVPVAASISTVRRHEAIGGEETAPGEHVFNLRGPGTYLLSAGNEDATRIEKEITVPEGVNDLSVDLDLPPE